MRQFIQPEFDESFVSLITDVKWQEEPMYYARYRERYLAVLREYAALADGESSDILEIGGGQLAYLASRLWPQDRAYVADINDACFAGLENSGVETFIWNLALDDSPIDRKFDVIFFSEVIEHLPIPGYIALERLKALLQPGGILLCSTPNLFRLRNVFYMATGRQLFDHFGLPGERGYGHVLEYSIEHLAWQFDKAGFKETTIAFREFRHTPNKPWDRVLASVGAPLRRFPRYRNNLVAVARA